MGLVCCKQRGPVRKLYSTGIHDVNPEGHQGTVKEIHVISLAKAYNILVTNHNHIILGYFWNDRSNHEANKSEVFVLNEGEEFVKVIGVTMGLNIPNFSQK